MERYLTAWRQYEVIEGGRAEGSAETYYRNVSQFIGFMKEEERPLEPERVTQADVQGFMKALFFRYSCKHNSTRAQKLSSLKAFFRYLNYAGVTENNPAANIRSPKFQRKMPTIFLTEELALLFSACDEASALGLRDLAILKTIYAAGLRVSELCALEIGDVTDRGGYIRLKIKGKGAKERMVTLRTNPSATLRKWLSFRATLETVHSRLFVSSKAHTSPLVPRSITNILKKYAALAGIPSADAFVHKLRATWATDLYDSGRDNCPRCGHAIEKIDILEICMLAGWSETKTAMRYIAVSEKVLNKTALPDRRFREIERNIERIREGTDAKE